MAGFRDRVSFVEWTYYDLHPEELWEPGHVSYDWCAKVTKELEIRTKKTAPGGTPGRSHSRAYNKHKASGDLARAIHAFGHRSGPESFRTVLNSPAPYSAFVHGGTGGASGSGYIYSTAGYANRAAINRLLKKGPLSSRSRLQGPSGRFISMKGSGMLMRLPLGTSLRATRRYHLRVRGQMANAFLVRGWNDTNAAHRFELGEFPEPIGFAWPKSLR